MDPISVGAAITTVAGLLAAGTKICKYVSDVKDAPKAAKSLEAEVGALNLSLANVRRFLDKNEEEGRGAYDNTSVLFRALSGCKGELESILEQLGHFRSQHRLSRVFHRLAWPLAEKDTIKAAEALHRYAQIFQLALSTDS